MGTGLLYGQNNIPGQANNFILSYPVATGETINSGDMIDFTIGFDGETETQLTSGGSSYNLKPTDFWGGSCGYLELLQISTNSESFVTLYNYGTDSLYATLGFYGEKSSIASPVTLEITNNIDFTGGKHVVSAARMINGQDKIGILYLSKDFHLTYCELVIDMINKTLTKIKERAIMKYESNLYAFDIICKNDQETFICYKLDEESPVEIQAINVIIEEDGETLLNFAHKISLSNSSDVGADNAYLIKTDSADGKNLVILYGGKTLYCGLVYFDGLLTQHSSKVITQETPVLDRFCLHIKHYKDDKYVLIYKTKVDEYYKEYAKLIQATNTTLTLYNSLFIDQHTDLQAFALAIHPVYITLYRETCDSTAPSATVSGYITGLVCQNNNLFIAYNSNCHNRYSNPRPYLKLTMTELKGTNRAFYTQQGSFYGNNSYFYADYLTTYGFYRKSAFFYKTGQNPQGVHVKKAFTSTADFSVTSGIGGDEKNPKDRVYISMPRKIITPKILVPLSEDSSTIWDQTELNNGNISFPEQDSVKVLTGEKHIIVREKTNFIPIVGHKYWFNTTASKQSGNNFSIHFGGSNEVMTYEDIKDTGYYSRGVNKIIECTEPNPLEIHFGTESSSATLDSQIKLSKITLLDLTEMFGEEVANSVTTTWLAKNFESLYDYNKIYNNI